MKKLYILSLLLLAFRITLFSQDYKVTSVEHLQNDMTARKTILTEKVNGGQQCAVIRISTQNILDLQRDLFQFECDMGSVIRERRKDGGEICLWVSPGIKILKIKHNTLGNYILSIPDMLNEQVQSLNTYRINIVGLKELPKETLSYGKCQMVFLPYPKDATLFINGDSIGTGAHSITSLSGRYHWAFKHPLYHTAEGDVKLTKGKIDTVLVNLDPAYGYMRILDGYHLDENEVLDVYLNGVHKGNVPFESDKLAPGLYDVTLKTGDSLMSLCQIEVKEHQVGVNRADELCRSFERANRFNSVNGYAMDSTFIAKRTRYYPITGKVTINSYPQSTVIIDSVDYGLTPVTVDSLTVGLHQLELSAKAYTTLKQNISVEEGRETPYYLSLKRSCVATIVTDQVGDHVYINKEFVGKTPVTIEKPFGTYSIYIVRLGYYSQEEEITLTSDNLEPTFDFSFGQTVSIETESKRAKLYLDDEYVGRTPNDFYISNGFHTLRAERGWKSGTKGIMVSKDSKIGKLNIETMTQSPTSFLSNGAFFLTGNLGFLNKGGKAVYGLNIGDIAKGGQAGWYFSFMTNRLFFNQLYQSYHDNYTIFDARVLANEEGEAVTGIQPTYTGEESLVRASALFGVALNVAGPVYLRIGGGYGFRRNAWKATDDTWVIIDPVSWQDFEGTLGLQCCIYNFVVNADALIPLQEVLTGNKKLFEFRVGLGFCLKHKR
jgi:hypothetical protein